MNSVLKTRNCVSKTRNCVLTMSGCLLFGAAGLTALLRDLPVGRHKTAAWCERIHQPRTHPALQVLEHAANVTSKVRVATSFNVEIEAVHTVA